MSTRIEVRLIALAALLGVLIPSASALRLDLFSGADYLNRTSNLVVTPGSELQLWTFASGSGPVSGLTYDIVLPNQPGILLTHRDYASHGWSIAAADDASTPPGTDGIVPFVAVAAPATVRFDTVGATGSELHFAGMPNGRGETSFDGYWVEDISFELPEDLALGNYTFTLTNFGAFDTNGNPLGAGAVGSLAIAVVPEPATILLFGLIVVGFFWLRRQNKAAKAVVPVRVRPNPARRRR